MINISKSGNAIKFAFTDSDHYLYGNGEIEVPVNSLSLIVDESNMVTFRKANSNDIFLSFDPANSNLSDKAGVIDFYKTQMVGSTGGSESGVTSGDVETMIDAALADYYTDDEVDAALSGKADTTAVTEEISAAVSGKADTTAVTAISDALTAHTADTGIHVSTQEKDAWNAKLDASAYTPVDLSEYWTSAQTEVAISAATSGKADASAVTAVASDVETLSATVETKQDALEYYEENTEDGWAEIIVTTDDGDGYTTDQHISIGGGLEMGNYQEYNDGQGNSGYTSTNIQLSNPEINMYAESEENGETEATYFNITPTGITINGENIATEPYVDAATSGKVDTSAITSAITSGSTDAEIPTAKAVYDAIPTGGGGATYSAGTNISIDTANTINCTLPISTTSNNQNSIKIGGGSGNAYGSGNILIGSSNNANFNNGLAIGSSITLGANNTLAVGQKITTLNEDQLSCGFYNVSNKANSTKGDSGNTLVSVGNGYYHYPIEGYHNALEIRQNGDIYFADTDNTTYQNYYEKPMVRLQDMYGELGNKLETSAITSAITSASTNAEVAGAKAVYDAIQAAGGGGGGSVTVDSTLDMNSSNPVENQAIAAPIEDIYNALDGSYNDGTLMVKLKRISQSDYDDLVNMGTTDSDTLYIITPDEENEGGE